MNPLLGVRPLIWLQALKAIRLRARRLIRLRALLRVGFLAPRLPFPAALAGLPGRFVPVSTRHLFPCFGVKPNVSAMFALKSRFLIVSSAAQMQRNSGTPLQPVRRPRKDGCSGTRITRPGVRRRRSQVPDGEKEKREPHANFRLSLVDYLAQQFPGNDAGANMTTANKAIELAQKNIVTAFVRQKVAR
ncbi:hypothetical protein [Bradyrhizobium sp.]|uniref:hypothetical protein n=1 Tax=Bradyrhizobium sp. TaxID=376 RepID=UPI003C74025C